MMNELESRGILQDGDLIEVRPEGQISINNNNLPASYNLPVIESGAQESHIIFNG